MAAGCEQLEAQEEGNDLSSSHCGTNIHLTLSIVCSRQVVCHTTDGKDEGAWRMRNLRQARMNCETVSQPGIHTVDGTVAHSDQDRQHHTPSTSMNQRQKGPRSPRFRPTCPARRHLVDVCVLGIGGFGSVELFGVGGLP